MSQLPTDYMFRKNSEIATGDNAGQYALGPDGVRRLVDVQTLFADSTPETPVKPVPKGLSLS